MQCVNLTAEVAEVFPRLATWFSCPAAILPLAGALGQQLPGVPCKPDPFLLEDYASQLPSGQPLDTHRPGTAVYAQLRRQ